MRLFKGNIIYTKNKNQFEVLENGYILEKDGIISDVGMDLIEKYPKINLIDYSNKLIIPGFVDLHFHAVQYGNLGVGLDEELLDWLNHYTFKEEIKFSDLKYAKLIFETALDDIIKNGTTRIVFFSSIHEEATKLLIDLCIERKIGAFVGKVNMDSNSPKELSEDTDESIAITKRLLKLGNDKVKSIITPRFAPSCSEELMMGLGKLGNNNYIQTHISENEDEVKWVKKLFPDSKDYLDVYLKNKLLSKNTILAHCVFITDEEKKIMKEKGCFIAHCPSANINLTSGIINIKDSLDRNMKIGLGTDVGAGNTVSIKDTIVSAIQMSKVNHIIYRENKILSLSEAFYLATKGGGEYFGKVGSFEKGYELDMLVVEPDELTLKRKLNIKEQLQRFIYSGDNNMIISRYCRGCKL